MPRLASLTLLLCLTSASALADDVKIYRCTDAAGKLTLRDSPCAKGERQETRTMLRPKDAPPRDAAKAPVVAPASAATPQVIVVNTPRPLYECVRPDGSVYDSESGDGEPRWVPLWTLDYPVSRETTRVRPGSARIRVDDGRVSGSFRSGDIRREVVPTLAGYGAGTWVRDACHVLPQAETCARLHDRRDAIRRRFFNAQPTERAALATEERGINARLDADCGGR